MYNWGEIRQEYLDGKPMLHIARERNNRPSVGTISKRCKKENWRALTKDNKHPGFKRLDYPETRMGILDALTLGATYKLAAESNGIKPLTLADWRKNDPDFDMACRRAHSAVAAKAISKIVSASDNGDLGASKFIVERHPESKHDYGVAQPQGGTMPTIVINIPRDESELPAVNRTIEHDPD